MTIGNVAFRLCTGADHRHRSNSHGNSNRSISQAGPSTGVRHAQRPTARHHHEERHSAPHPTNVLTPRGNNVLRQLKSIYFLCSSFVLSTVRSYNSLSLSLSLSIFSLHWLPKSHACIHRRVLVSGSRRSSHFLFCSCTVRFPSICIYPHTHTSKAFCSFVPSSCFIPLIFVVCVCISIYVFNLLLISPVAFDGLAERKCLFARTNSPPRGPR